MNNRKILKYHSYFGLITGVFVVLLGISGAILAFSETIDEAAFEKYEVENTDRILNLDQAIKTVQQTYPDWETRIVHFKEGKTILFNLRRPDARRYVFVNSKNGEIIANIDSETQFTKWLLTFHYSLHAGTFGRILILLMGVLFFLSLLTGIIIYRKMIFKIIFFKVKLKRKNKRNFYSVLHRYVGVWALLLNLLLVITGIVLAYGVALSRMQQAPEPHSPKITFSIEKSLKEIAREYPDFHPTYIRLPKEQGAPVTVNGTFENDTFYWSEFYNKIQLDGTTGTLNKVIKVSDADFATQLNSVVSPLHFGQFGGFWIKILYVFIGLSGPFLSVSGFIIWLKRKNNGSMYTRRPKNGKHQKC